MLKDRFGFENWLDRNIQNPLYVETAERILDPEPGKQAGTICRINISNGIAKADQNTQQWDSRHPIDDKEPLENFALTLKKIGEVGPKLQEALE